MGGAWTSILYCVVVCCRFLLAWAESTDLCGSQLVTDCLGLICASHHGLIEEELLEMLGSGWDGSETLPRGIWAQLQQNISFIVSKFRGVQVGVVANASTCRCVVCDDAPFP